MNPKKIYSITDADQLLAVVQRGDDIGDSRIDLAPSEEYLQASCKKLSTETTFKPHKHIEVIRNTDMTQEAWVILKGAAEVDIYDFDDAILYTTVLKSGDCLITFRGGHGFKVVEEDTVLYEFKNGPYYGVKADKVFLSDE